MTSSDTGASNTGTTAAASGSSSASGGSTSAVTSSDASANGTGGPTSSASSSSTTGARDAGPASGGTGGVADAGSDATVNAGGNPCPSGVLFCDDFEGAAAGGPPDPAHWTIQLIGSGKVSIDATTPAHSGTRSVHVSTSDSDYDTFFVLKGAPAFPNPGDPFYVRTYIRLAAPMSPGHNTYFDIVKDAPQALTHDTRVGVNLQMLIINQIEGDVGYNSNPTYYTDGMKPGVQFPPSQWVCLEVFLNVPNHEIDVWVDGKEVPGLHVLTWQQDAYDSIRFGYEKYAGPAIELWYDDVAVSSRPIGCSEAR